ncbi:hypothetical protein H5410_056304 [Solanum commersonii]|uniref:Uncharacterized protein n=1 Tax=Solanum commersonii TaxID=4109 RepID=A0A9J5WKX4_SOLCO|nr:hypothetical protein H5410_056304 [Solanum commersonii]
MGYFYWHWKHITLWQGNASRFNESSTYLMGWLRDYLWLNSSQLINGYNPFGMNSLSVWGWMFLFGHLVWAIFGFMFLTWAHLIHTLANLIRWRDKPKALSIVQARLVGLAHFSIGYIFTYGFLDCLYAGQIWLINDSTCIMDTNRNSTIMARKSLIQREKKRQNWNEISFDSPILKKEISKVPAVE